MTYFSRTKNTDNPILQIFGSRKTLELMYYGTWNKVANGKSSSETSGVER